MKTNLAARTSRAGNAYPEAFTHEGAPAHSASLDPWNQLRRSVLSCMLFEGEFYEDGESIAARIKRLVPQVDPVRIAALAREARGKFNLRHAPLLLAAVLADHSKGNSIVEDLVRDIVQRADEFGELLAIRARITGKEPRKALTHGLRRGLAAAFAKFGEYGFAKYDRDSAAIKLRDVMRLVHPAPLTDGRSALYARVVKRELKTPDTWEVALSSGADKKETWERLLGEGKLGYLALLRNLRNMEQASVRPDLIRANILARLNGAERVLPFRFIAAARAAPEFEPDLDLAMIDGLKGMPDMPGTTVALIDVSGSMFQSNISAKSELTRGHAAAALAAMINGQRKVYSFSNELREVPPRNGMALVDAIVNSQHHGGTYLGDALRKLAQREPLADRVIVITDEQSHDRVDPPAAGWGRAYMINVASNRSGVGYGKWLHIDGFSEATLNWIAALEVPPLGEGSPVVGVQSFSEDN